MMSLTLRRILVASILALVPACAPAVERAPAGAPAPAADPVPSRDELEPSSRAQPPAAQPPSAETRPGRGIGQPLQVGTVGDLHVLVDSVATTPPLHRTRWGIEVRDLATGEPLLRRNAEKLFTAASNAKIAVMVAALDLLGPDYRYRTEVRVPGGGDGVGEAVIVRGAGAPTFSTHFHDDPLAPLDSLADSLAMAGLRRVEGPLVVDASRFDSTLVHPAWEVFDLDWYYAAPVSAFAVMQGALPIVVTPSAVGGAARVDLLAPAELVRIDADIRTVEGDDDWDDELVRLPGEDRVVLRGTIGVGAGPDTSWVAQIDPNRVAGRALALALESRGIVVTGPVVVRYQDGPATEHGGAGSPELTTAWTSPPLAELVPLSLEESDNWVTEMILRTMGAEVAGDASWSASTGVVEEHLAAAAGFEPDAIYLRDGSGLSQQTLFTPHALVAILDYAAQRPWAELFRQSLAAPGEAESTLEDRLLPLTGRLQAKTGTIRHVNSLSGYVRTDDGRVLVFSILSNGSGRPSSEVRDGIDRIVLELAEDGT